MVTPTELLRRLGLPDPSPADLAIAAEIIEDILDSAARFVERNGIGDHASRLLAARLRLLHRPPGKVSLAP